MKTILLPLFLFCGCYGGSTVECESLINTNKYTCEVDTKEADICFDVIFSDGTKENRCIEDDTINNKIFLFSKRTTNSSIVSRTEITSESYSSSSFFLIVFLTCFFWFILICFSIVIALIEDQAMKKRHYTITLLFVCLFHFIGLGILYLIDKTREEIRDRNTKK
jgi:hypothetical protein